MRDILLVGGGVHCHSVIDVIESTNKYNIVGILDTVQNIGKKILGYEIIGCDDDLNKFRQDVQFACVTVGSKGNNFLRKKLYNILLEEGYELPNIIASTAYVSKYVTLGIGNVIMHQSMLNTNCKIGNNNVINSKSLLEHDVIIGSDNYISTSANINGTVTIGNNCYIGSNSVINQVISVSDDIIIGSGAIVTKDCSEKGVYIGIPAQKK